MDISCVSARTRPRRRAVSFRVHLLKARSLSTGVFVLSISIAGCGSETMQPDPPDLWIQQDSGTTAMLHDICSTSSLVATVVGNQGTILHTTDGGMNWIQQGSRTNTHLLGVSFIDSDNGVAVGGDSTILRTSDGGASWTTQVTAQTGFSFAGVCMTDAQTCTVVGSRGTILRTTDGGSSWLLQDSGTTRTLTSVSFADADVGVAVGIEGLVLQTTDAGANWVLRSSGTPEDLYDVQLTHSNIGMAVGFFGRMLRTEDRGASWMLQRDPETSHWLRRVALVSGNVAFLVGATTLLRTVDGGTTWTRRTGSPYSGPFGFLGVAAVDESTATVVCSNGLLLRTTFSGQ